MADWGFTAVRLGRNEEGRCHDENYTANDSEDNDDGGDELDDVDDVQVQCGHDGRHLHVH